MSSLTASDALVDLLRQAKEMTEIRDRSGTIIGFFAPASKVDARECYTTKQVFERLLSLTKDEKMRTYLQQKIQVLAERDACVLP